MYIAEITERLLEVNRLLLKYIKDTKLTFEENLVFSGFYHDYKDINSIINSAEKELNDSPAILMQKPWLPLRLTSLPHMKVTRIYLALIIRNQSATGISSRLKRNMTLLHMPLHNYGNGILK